MSNLYPVFPQMGIVTNKDDPSATRMILGAGATPDQKQLQIVNDTGKTEKHDTDSVTVDPVTARINYVSGGSNFNIREPREEDGVWLSQCHISLPLEALRAFALRGEDNMNPDEELDAYVTDDSPYVVALVYSNGVGQWTRVDGDWTLLAADDDTFDDMDSIEIDPDRAQDFIDLYDSNYVTITDAQQYESAESDDDGDGPDDESDPTDAESDAPSDDQ